MNIFHKVALQGLKKNRTQTIVTIIGVILSAAMITAVITFGLSLLHYMINGSVQRYGDWHIAFLDVDSSFVQERSLDEEAAGTVTFENIGYAPFDGGNNQDKPYLFIAGFYEETFETLPITLLSGRLPENSGEILMTGKAALNGSVSYGTGDPITLTVGQKERTYTVVGICQTPVFEQDSSPAYTAITRADSAEAADDFSLFVKLKHPRRVKAYAEAAADGHAYILNNSVLRLMGISDDPADHVFLAFLYSFAAIVIAIIMTGSVFLIYNSFAISLNERTRQIGILSSVGATERQLRNSVLFEGLCIGAVGIPLGILAGLCSIGLVIAVVARRFGDILYSDVPFTLYVSVPAMAGAAVVSIVTILISAYIPAKKAAGVPVMECIRQTNEVKVEARAVKTSGLALRIFGMEGVLALKNFKRNRKRYRSVVLSLVLSIVLFISTSALVTGLRQSLERLTVVTDYDIGFGTQDMDDSQMLRLYDKLKNTDGVYKSSYQALMMGTCAVRADRLSDDYWETAGGRPSDQTVNLPMEIQFFDDATYLNLVQASGLRKEDYTGPDGNLIAVAKMLNSSNQTDGVGQLPDLFTESSMEVSVTPGTESGPDIKQGQNVSLTCVEIVPPDSPPMTGTVEKQPYYFQIMAPWSRKESLVPSATAVDIRVKGFTFQSEHPSQSEARMKAVIQEAGLTSPYILMNTSSALEESRNHIFITNVFAYTFIIMMSLIAVANVFNTISTNIRLRRQEFAMLRSVGMSDRAFNKMMRFECVFYGMKALLFGLPLAALASRLIFQEMFIVGAAGVDFALPWASIGLSVLGVFLVVFITVLYATSRIKRENIMDALRDDMT